MLLRGVPCWWGIVGVFITLKVATGYQLTAPQNYTVFMGDVRVSYSVGNSTFLNAMVQLLTVPNNTIVSTIGIPHDYKEGELTFMCGIIDYAGNFRFRLIQYYGGPTLIETKIMYVSWPLFKLTLPPSHRALTKEVILQFATETNLCENDRSNSRFWIDVIYYGKNDSTTNIDDPNRHKTVIHRQELQAITQMNDVQLSFPCKYFDQAGIYQVFFFSSNSPAGTPIAASNRMHVQWSDLYSLRSQVDSIFPCVRFVSIYYTQPECSGVEDKIRMYKQLQIAESSVASPTNLFYVGEKRVDKRSNYVSFKCSMFQEAVPGYCFKYASIAHNGAVHEQRTLCLLSSANADVAIHGAWSDWAQWSMCTGGTTCGHGQRSRYRQCDNPPPSRGGKYCVGNTVEWADCSLHCKDMTTMEPLDAYTPDPACTCGCTLTRSKGKIIGTTSKCRGSSVWIIEADEGLTVHLNFELFTLSNDDRNTWLKVRDGDSHRSDLLMQQFGGPLPKNVRSKQNRMLIELMSPYDSGSYIRTNQVFVATYRSMPGNGTTYVSSGGSQGKKSWESTVTLVGVGLCIIIIIAVVAFICHHRITRRHHKAKKQQALLTPNGSLPNSPSHSHSLQSPSHCPAGSSNVTFATEANPARRDYVMAKGVTAHAGVPPEGRSRSHKVRSPVGGRKLAYNVDTHGGLPRPGSAHSNASHTPSSVYASPPQSPYEAKEVDFVHDPKMFQANLDKKRHQHKHKGSHHHSPSPSRSPRAGSPGVSPERKPPASLRSRSPGSQSPGSRDSRNQSFKKAITKVKGKDGVPLADEEDLSPVSPSTPFKAPLYTPAEVNTDRRRGRDRDKSTEFIPMNSYDTSKRFRDSGIEDTPVGMRSPDSDPRRSYYSPSSTESRPPVEGRDSLGRYRSAQPYLDPHTYPKSPNTPDRQNGNFLPSGDQRPDLKPLPLRNVQRPDGQSPENHHVDDPNANTPSSADGLSPMLKKTALFGENPSHAPSLGSIATMEDYEYDDYMPSLPGSYFTMDPHAYTLTWSQQQPWAQKRVPNSSSEKSVTPSNNESNA